MKKNILILGGTGAMGTYLVDILNKTNQWNIFVTSRKQRINKENINYIVGNARDNQFIKNVCTEHFDIIVDFMNYGLEEFQNNYEVLLNSTDHYYFLSSCRVYANQEIVTEETPRLLDTIDDEEFLSTQRYALRKAREENILINSDKKNWTIIRPYITYSTNRLQLGVYEKEDWLYRILNNKELIIRKDILDKNTSLTYGYDVANAIYRILGNEKLCGDKINIVTSESIKWEEILSIYLEVIDKLLDIKPMIYTSNNIEEIEELFEGGYNTKYDRLWNRKFDNSKMKEYCGDLEFKTIKNGLTECLTGFINEWIKNGNIIFENINEEYNCKMDNLCKNKNIPRR